MTDADDQRSETHGRAGVGPRLEFLGREACSPKREDKRDERPGEPVGF